MAPWVRTVVALALLAHGLGMIGGGLWLAASNGRQQGWGDSWLLGRAGRAVQSIVAVLLWCGSGAAFVAAAYAFWASAPWLDTAILVGAPTTLLAVALWAGAVPVGAYIGAVFAAIVLAAVLLGRL
jgi:hypothetical protein